MKKILILLMVTIILFGCGNSSVKDIHVGSIINESNEVITDTEIIRSLEEKYDNKAFLRDNSDLKAQIYDELDEYVNQLLKEYVDGPYVYTLDLELTHFGYYNYLSKNTDIITWLNSITNDIYRVEINLHLFESDVDEIMSNLAEDEYHGYDLSNREILMSKLNENVIFRSFYWDEEELKATDLTMLNNAGDETKLRAELYYNEADLDSTFHFNCRKVLDQLNGKYNQKFMRVGNRFCEVLDSEITLYAPINNLEITFQRYVSEDKYLSSFSQYKISNEIDRILYEMELDEKISYFLSSDNSTIKSVDMSKEDIYNFPADLDNTMTLAFYTFNNSVSEEQLIELTNAIHTKIRSQLIICVYPYKMDESNIPVMMKLLAEQRLSEIYLLRDHGIDNLGFESIKVRNHSDCFTYLDIYGVRDEFIYKINGYIRDDVTNLEDYKRKNKFDVRR